jgi:lipoic acid synthetase
MFRIEVRNSATPVERKPEEFIELRKEAEGLGFGGVMSGPLVRSSYRAGSLFAPAREKRSETIG